MTEDAADGCFSEEHIHSWFGHPCCCFTNIVRKIMFFVFLPIILIRVVLQICGCTCLSDVNVLFPFLYKSTAEFDYTHRTVILRMFRRFCCLCSYRLLREQRLPFESIDSFKFGPFQDLSSKGRISMPSHWKQGGWVVLLTVKRPLGEAKDGFLAQELPIGCCSCNSSKVVLVKD
jgi:hypothetical protein